jgi:hypothetical protein
MTITSRLIPSYWREDVLVVIGNGLKDMHAAVKASGKASGCKHVT